VRIRLDSPAKSGRSRTHRDDRVLPLGFGPRRCRVEPAVRAVECLVSPSEAGSWGKKRFCLCCEDVEVSELKVRVVLNPASYSRLSRCPLPSGTVLCGVSKIISSTLGPGRVLISRTELRMSASSRCRVTLVCQSSVGRKW
jgi:hypothetical protein